MARPRRPRPHRAEPNSNPPVHRLTAAAIESTVARISNLPYQGLPARRTPGRKQPTEPTEHAEAVFCSRRGELEESLPEDLQACSHSDHEPAAGDVKPLRQSTRVLLQTGATDLRRTLVQENPEKQGGRTLPAGKTAFFNRLRVHRGLRSRRLCVRLGIVPRLTPRTGRFTGRSGNASMPSRGDHGPVHSRKRPRRPHNEGRAQSSADRLRKDPRGAGAFNKPTGGPGS